MDLFWGLLANIVFFLFGLFFSRFLNNWQLRHIIRFIGKSKTIKIVLPSFSVKEFYIIDTEEKSIIPKNVHLMPLEEGRSIANLVNSIGLLKNDINIDLIPYQSFSDDGTPFISIGGPSVNRISRNIIEGITPDFRIVYPEHIGKIGTTTYEPNIDSCSNITEDFGFIIHAKSNINTRCIVLCGIWAFGTRIATKSLLKSQNNFALKGIYNLISKNKNFISVTHSNIFGLEIQSKEPNTILPFNE